MQWVSDIFLVFMPLFVAIDAIGLVPMFLSLTVGIEDEQLKKMVRNATVAAFILSILFVFGGRMVFDLLGITADDFRIGGGLVLFLIAITDLLFSQQENRRMPRDEIGVVPLGIPLILGPGSMTTILILVDKFGYIATLCSIIVNLLLAWLILSKAKYLVRIIGPSGASAFAKVASLFLVAISVMMIRIGITNTFFAK